MRGDFEILGYNMIQWLSGSLLWEKNSSDPVAVQKQKEKAFDDIPEFLNNSFHGSVPNAVLKYMTLLAGMKFNETPDYEKFKKILTDGLKQLSHKPDGKLEFKDHINNHTASAIKPAARNIKETLDRNRKNPRLKLTKLQSPAPSLDDSTIGVVMDKKRGCIKDIKRILNDIESDEEYDIKIVKKTKKPAESVPVNESADDKPSLKSRRKVRSNHRNESISDTESEVIRDIRSYFTMPFELMYEYDDTSVFHLCRLYQEEQGRDLLHLGRQQLKAQKYVRKYCQRVRVLLTKTCLTRNRYDRQVN